MQVCTLLQTDNHASNPPLSFLQAGCPSCRPTNSVKALKGLLKDLHSEICVHYGIDFVENLVANHGNCSYQEIQ